MNPISNYCREQYEFIRGSRGVLLDYCKSISPVDLQNQNSSFGRGGSMKNLLIHIANTYQFWIGKIGLNKDIVFTNYELDYTIDQIIDLYVTIDKLVDEFIQLIEDSDAQEINYELDGTNSRVKPFKLFSHVITHEFHHKGQILSISRHLGYIPVDTDIMR